MNQEFLENIGIEVSHVSGEEIQFKCPFHDDKNPSASFNTTNLVYNCFVCGGGSLKYLAKQLGHEYLSEELDKIPPSVVSLERQLMELMDEKIIDEDIFENNFYKLENQIECPSYLLNRVEFETILEFDLHICKSNKSIYDERIIFPIYSNDKRGYIARDYTEIKPQKYLFPKNMQKQDYLFGNFKNDAVIIVEGVFDVMKLWEYGYYSCISTMGVTIGDKQAEIIINNGIKDIIIMPDGDGAGMKFVERILEYKDMFNIEAMFSITGKDPCDMGKYEVDHSYKKRWNLNEWAYERNVEKQFTNLNKNLLN